MIHKAWSLAANKAKGFIADRFQYSLTTVHCGQQTPLERASLGVENNELFITEPYVREIASPPPIGQLVEPQYQLQQPALFGAFVFLFSPHLHSPWRSDVDASWEVLELDQLRAELIELDQHPFSKIVFNSFLAAHLKEKLESNSHLAEEVLAREFATSLLLDVYARLKLGTARVLRQRRTLRDLRWEVVEIFGENNVAAFEEMLGALVDADGNDAKPMLELGSQWQAISNSIDYEMLDDVALYDLLSAYVDLIDDMAKEDVAALQIAHPPAITPLAVKKSPRTMQEWAQKLAGEDNQDELDDAHNINGNDEETLPGGDEVGEDGTDDASNAGLGIPAGRWIEYRKPTDVEQRQAIALSQTFKQLRYRRPYMARHGVQTPGGRLDTRQLVQMTAQRTRGTAITATPWQRQMAIPNEQPGITAALVLDTSASMATSRQAILSLNWVLSQAAHTVGGTVATWGFGGDIFELIRAGTQPAQVPIAVDTGAGSDGAALALARAADAAKLETCGGVRVAVVITDGSLDVPGSDEQSSSLESVFHQLQQAGVITLMLQVGGNTRNVVKSAKIVDCGLVAQDMVQNLEKEILAAYEGAS